MGDRIGIQFTDNIGNLSPIVHSHWMGKMLLKRAQQFLKEYDGRTFDGPNQALALFLQWHALQFGLEDNLDVQDSEDDSDCEDHGVYCANIDDGTVS